MSHPAIDDAAWTNRWRNRSTAEKAVLALGLVAVAVTTTRSAVALSVVVVAMSAALVGARVAPRIYLRAVLAPAVFVLLAGASVALSVGPAPEPVWRWGPVVVTTGGAERAVGAVCRSLAAMSALMLLATTTPVVDLLEGLRRLRVPEVVIDLAGLTYRFLFTGLQAVSSIRQAQSARLGYRTGGAARRCVAGLGTAVLVRTWTQARRLEDGLAGRGYTTSLRTLAVPQPISWPFIAASVMVLAALGCWSAGLVP